MNDPAFSGAPPRAPDGQPNREVPTGLLDPPGSEPSSTQLWMHRISVFLFVLISAVAGVLLIILPWTDEWRNNHLLLWFPTLGKVAANGFVRGICSGLGLLDIWIGFWEALHYHEHQ